MIYSSILVFSGKSIKYQTVLKPTQVDK